MGAISAMLRSNPPFGSWPSPFSAARVTAGVLRLDQIQLDGDEVYWIEGRASEGGRSVIVRRSRDGEMGDVTPPGFNVRTRVHEYGGGAYTVDEGTVYFSNFADQRIYRQQPGKDAGGDHRRGAVLRRLPCRSISQPADRPFARPPSRAASTRTIWSRSGRRPACRSKCWSKARTSIRIRSSAPTASFSPGCNGITRTCRGTAPSCGSRCSTLTACGFAGEGCGRRERIDLST